MSDKTETDSQLDAMVSVLDQEQLTRLQNAIEKRLEAEPEPEWPGEGGYCRVWQQKPHPSLLKCAAEEGRFVIDVYGTITTWEHWSPVHVLQPDEIALKVVEYTGDNAPVGKSCFVKFDGKWRPYTLTIHTTNDFINREKISHFAVLPE